MALKLRCDMLGFFSKIIKDVYLFIYFSSNFIIIQNIFYLYLHNIYIHILKMLLFLLYYDINEVKIKIKMCGCE